MDPTLSLSPINAVREYGVMDREGCGLGHDSTGKHSLTMARWPNPVVYIARGEPQLRLTLRKMG